MIIEEMKLSELRSAEYNPRKMKDENKKRLENSIREFGYIDPIIYNKRTGNIVGGNQRYEQLVKIYGNDEIVKVVVVDLDISKEKALNIALNNQNLQGEYDETKLLELLNELQKEGISSLSGYEEKEISRMRDLMFEPKEDDVPEKRQETDIKKGDIFLLGNHRVMCGDSANREDVEKLMDGKKADIVFTDPPYGVSYTDKNEYLNSIAKGNKIQTPIENDQKTTEELKETLIYPAFCNIRSSLKDNGSFYITAPQGGDLLLMMMMMMKSGLTLRHMLIWVKNNHVIGRSDYNYKHEPILFGWIKKHNFYGRGKHKFSTWEIDKPHKSELHPTMKPIELITNALLNSSERNDICIDIFLGSGSSVIACEQTDRICYGMEIDPIYCQVIIDRWEKFTGKKAKKVE